MIKNKVVIGFKYFILSAIALLINHYLILTFTSKNIFNQLDEVYNFAAANLVFVIIASIIPLIIYIVFRGIVYERPFYFGIIFLFFIALTQTIGRSQIAAELNKEYDNNFVLAGRNIEEVGENYPWFKVKNYLVVLPFILCIENGHASAPLIYEGETSYYLWFMGLKLKLAEFNKSGLAYETSEETNDGKN